jgi:hypothetical protein
MTHPRKIMLVLVLAPAPKNVVENSGRFLPVYAKNLSIFKMLLPLLLPLLAPALNYGPDALKDEIHNLPGIPGGTNFRLFSG